MTPADILTRTAVLYGLGAAATRAEANPRYAQQLAAVRGVSI